LHAFPFRFAGTTVFLRAKDQNLLPHRGMEVNEKVKRFA